MEARTVTLGEVATIGQGLVTSGRGAGARAGDWELRLASVGDLQDDRLGLDDLPLVRIEQNVKTEKHLLQTDDLLVAARSTVVKVALMPPPREPTAADATLLVVRADAHWSDLGPYLWWLLSSELGRSRLRARMSGSTVLALSSASLAELEVPLPDVAMLGQIADLVAASERAYESALEAARLRRGLFRERLAEVLTIQAARAAGGEGSRLWR